MEKNPSGKLTDCIYTSKSEVDSTGHLISIEIRRHLLLQDEIRRLFITVLDMYLTSLSCPFDEYRMIRLPNIKLFKESNLLIGDGIKIASY